MWPESPCASAERSRARINTCLCPLPPRQCPDGCGDCTGDPKRCRHCSFGGLAANGTCVPCAVPQCVGGPCVQLSAAGCATIRCRAVLPAGASSVRPFAESCRRLLRISHSASSVGLDYIPRTANASRRAKAAHTELTAVPCQGSGAAGAPLTHRRPCRIRVHSLLPCSVARTAAWTAAREASANR